MISSDALFIEALRQLKIFSLSPEYWEVDVLIPDTPLILSQGESKELLNIKERGKLIFLHTVCTSKKALLEVKIDDMTIRGTPEEVYRAGLVGFNPSTYWLSKYDEANNKYVILYTPIPPREYYGRIYAKFYASRDEPVMFKYTAVRYRFVG